MRGDGVDGGWRRHVALSLLVVWLAGACSPGTTTDGPVTAENPPVAGDRSAKPDVVVPEQVPEGLVVEDLVVGQGRPAALGDIVTVHLVVAAVSTGEQIDSTWELAAPRRIPLVQGGAVEGFLQGVTGMAPGGRRHLVVPPDLAYGDTGAPPSVGPGETLVIVVDVLSIDTPRA